MNNVHLIYLDDWVGIYIDGVLKNEGHSFQEDTLLTILGIPHTVEWVDYGSPIDEIMKIEGRLPNTLPEWEKLKNG